MEFVWMFKEQRQIWNLLEPESFDIYKNTIALIIAMLDCSGLDTEIPDTGMKTVEPNEYREVSVMGMPVVYWL